MDSQNDVRQLIVGFAKDNWSLSALEVCLILNVIRIVTVVEFRYP